MLDSWLGNKITNFLLDTRQHTACTHWFRWRFLVKYHWLVQALTFYFDVFFLFLKSIKISSDFIFKIKIWTMTVRTAHQWYHKKNSNRILHNNFLPVWSGPSKSIYSIHIFHYRTRSWRTPRRPWSTSWRSRWNENWFRIARNWSEQKDVIWWLE